MKREETEKLQELFEESMANNNEMERIQYSIFEDNKMLNEFGQEYWSARAFYKILDYQRWDGFINVIDKAKEACINSGQNELDHFRRVTKMVEIFPSNPSRLPSRVEAF